MMVPHYNQPNKKDAISTVEYVCIECEYKIKVEWYIDDLGSTEQILHKLTEKEEEYNNDIKSASDLKHNKIS